MPPRTPRFVQYALCLYLASLQTQANPPRQVSTKRNDVSGDTRLAGDSNRPSLEGTYPEFTCLPIFPRGNAKTFELQRFGGYWGGSRVATLSSDNKQLWIYCHTDSTLRCWDTSDGRELSRWVLSAEINGIDISEDGKYLLVDSWYEGGSLILIDVVHGRVGLTLMRRGRVRPKGCFADNGRSLVTVGEQSGLQVYELATGQLSTSLDVSYWKRAKVQGVAVSSDASRIATGLFSLPSESEADSTHKFSNGGGIVRVQDLRSGRIINDFPFHPDIDGCGDIALSPNGKQLTIGERISGRSLPTSTVWDVDRAEVIPNLA